MRNFTNRMEEFLKNNKRKKEAKPYYYGLFFLLTVSLSFPTYFRPEVLGGSGFLMRVMEAIFISSVFIIIPPLIHIVIASLWASKRNNRTRRNIILAWLIFSFLINLNFILR